MFDTTIKATYLGLKGEQFAWTILLTREQKTFESSYSAGLAHCRRAKTFEPKGTPKEKVTQKIARALKPFGTLVIDDCSGDVVPTAPTLKSFLECLQSDSRAGESLLFEDFADEFGYDADSRKAEEIWRACQKTRGELMKFFGQEFEAFMSTNFDAAEEVAS